MLGDASISSRLPPFDLAYPCSGLSVTSEGDGGRQLKAYGTGREPLDQLSRPAGLKNNK